MIMNVFGHMQCPDPNDKVISQGTRSILNHGIQQYRQHETHGLFFIARVPIMIYIVKQQFCCTIVLLHSLLQSSIVFFHS